MNYTKFLIYIFLISMISSGCSRKTFIEGERQWDYANFRAGQKTFKSDDGAIKYVDRGSGPVIMLLHGIPTSSWLYRKMIDGLVDNGYRVIAPDMLGFGNSDSPDGYSVYSAEAHGRRVLQLMEHLSIETWSHVMHDAGGQWSWEMLIQDPTKVQNLIILNSIIYDEGLHPPVKMKPGIFALIAMWGYKNGITTNFLLRQLFKSGLKQDILTKQEVAGYKTPLREGKTKGMYRFFTQTSQPLPDYRKLLQSLKVRTMVVWGSHDEMLQWTPQSKAVTSDLRIPTEDIHIIDAKHFIQEEKPEEINKLILEFLSKNSG